ncbi:N-acetylmuramic acid 6-phosphate etherase [Sinorhizobium meliloti WSM1022]|uniref:N-acetylmuramic acid 6-phosphate etherase n=2 Tax=Rhizobium meliloti TaxID=382 RepID=UPI000408C535|nr:N-acetylmuramic acid 6-phosphate etherase [Sinorhizobium meliloti]ASQ05424.1 N-acetylmuramic acid 6-phosphate etherase [Sinorhizobium meliloti]MCO6422833.1 N-acetylmuramic acid 6-phosphate etherase [Sinorhizobium meliloti]MDW9412614.1 N-acetylmuramic acid 6-phosphate etherase [Sinorhizobium meliloti]MDW9443386.1 N-acetylmuramic acid 6-phosphate etherase [Sinorhizobium meliloti]MDW9458108.1 N-acetylmuramic acid 6-phosphate etherase [Sinorhizobium meliloti]
MPPAKTEERRDNAKGLDVMRPELALRLLAAGQQEAAKSVEQAIEPISAAARLAADSLASGGRLAYAGAGSSGLMAMADALELPGTYGIAREQVVILIAGGAASLTDLAGGYEDDMELARADVRSAGIGAGDCLISVSASGSTPYAIAAADEAGKRGARVIGMANNAGAPLLLNADVSILLETPPEVVSGSTRMGAGTAQKIAFNMFSTMVGIHLGHVLDGHMVNLRADNIKLRGRAIRIVSDIAGIGAADADRLLGLAGGSVKLAILLASGARDIAHAEDALERADQNLRRAIAIVGT